MQEQLSRATHGAVAEGVKTLSQKIIIFCFLYMQQAVKKTVKKLEWNHERNGRSKSS